MASETVGTLAAAAVAFAYRDRTTGIGIPRYSVLTTITTTKIQNTFTSRHRIALGCGGAGSGPKRPRDTVGYPPPFSLCTHPPPSERPIRSTLLLLLLLLLMNMKRRPIEHLTSLSLQPKPSYRRISELITAAAAGSVAAFDDQCVLTTGSRTLLNPSTRRRTHPLPRGGKFNAHVADARGGQTGQAAGSWVVTRVVSSRGRKISVWRIIPIATGGDLTPLLFSDTKPDLLAEYATRRKGLGLSAIETRETGSVAYFFIIIIIARPSTPPWSGKLWIAKRNPYTDWYGAPIGKTNFVNAAVPPTFLWLQKFRVNTCIQILLRGLNFHLHRSRRRSGGPTPATGRQPGQREAGHRKLRETLEGVCRGRARHFTQQHRSSPFPAGPVGWLQGVFVFRVFLRGQPARATVTLKVRSVASAGFRSNWNVARADVAPFAMVTRAGSST